jgi:hypothetical protein
MTCRIYRGCKHARLTTLSKATFSNFLFSSSLPFQLLVPGLYPACIGLHQALVVNSCEHINYVMGYLNLLNGIDCLGHAIYKATLASWVVEKGNHRYYKASISEP